MEKRENRAERERKKKSRMSEREDKGLGRREGDGRK